MISHKRRSKNYLWLILTIAGLMLFTLTCIYIKAPPEVAAKLANYIQILTLIIFSITCMITVFTFKEQTEERSRQMGFQYANMAQSEIVDVDKLFISNPLLDRLYFQIYAHDPNIQKIVAMRGSIVETPDMLKAEHQAANLIFQKIANIYACEKLDEPGHDCIEFLNLMKSWMSSPILRSHWRYLKYEQHPDVRHFVDKCLIARNKFIKS